MVINEHVVRLWVMIYFKVIFRDLLGKTGEKHDNPRSGWPVSGPGFGT
jgi:hypothetical protein